MLSTITKDAYAYARRLLDVLFTKEEQIGHCLLLTTKSKKPCLEEKKVNLLFGERKKIFV